MEYREPRRLDLLELFGDDADMPVTTLEEVKGKVRLLKAGGAPGPDCVTKGGLLQYSGMGCRINSVVLDELIRLGQKAKLVGVLLDVAKAFYTMSHEAVQVALRHQLVPPLLCRLIDTMYNGATTRLGSFGADVAIRREVNQGGPFVSPAFQPGGLIRCNGSSKIRRMALSLGRDELLRWLTQMM